MAIRKKSWDCALSEKRLEIARERRMNPDGEQHEVSHYVRSNGELIMKYPWSKMKDGDFFIAPVLRSKYAMEVNFRQAAARHDMEISMCRWEVDGETAIRVTRVMGNIRSVKAAARKLGARAPSADIEARNKYLRGLRKDKKEGVERQDDGPGFIPISKPTEPIAGVEKVSDYQYDRASRLEEARRKAAIEVARGNAGLGPEDTDVMGVDDV